MALLTRKIKRQIQSIKNTKKITKAMELVSASKMRKAVNAVLASRPYSQLAWQIVLNLAARTQRHIHPLLHQRQKVKSIGILLLSSNRGLCGVFNQQIAREAINFVQTQIAHDKEVNIEFITLGKKAGATVAKAGLKIAADFEKPDVVTDVSQIKAISAIIINDYLTRKYDKVILFFTDFISSLRQKPNYKQLLPLSHKESGLGLIGEEQASQVVNWDYEYLFEPSRDYILENFLPKLIELQIYQAILESNASEHSARMMAMRNASDAAVDLVADLTLTFNKARQADITQEISEISVSKAALES